MQTFMSGDHPSVHPLGAAIYLLTQQEGQFFGGSNNDDEEPTTMMNKLNDEYNNFKQKMLKSAKWNALS